MAKVHGQMSVWVCQTERERERGRGRGRRERGVKERDSEGGRDRERETERERERDENRGPPQSRFSNSRIPYTKDASKVPRLGVPGQTWSWQLSSRVEHVRADLSIHLSWKHMHGVGRLRVSGLGLRAQGSGKSSYPCTQGLGGFGRHLWSLCPLIPKPYINLHTNPGCSQHCLITSSSDRWQQPALEPS